MARSTIIGGVNTVTVNGVAYPVRGDVKVSLGTTSRESVIGVNGLHGFKKVYAAAWIECTMSDFSDLDMSVLQDMENATVRVELANGKSATLSNASQVNKLELDAIEGQYPVKFEGESTGWTLA